MTTLAIALTMLTHPLQVFLIGMVLVRLAREGLVVVTRARPSPTDPDGSAVRAAGSSDLQAA